MRKKIFIAIIIVCILGFQSINSLNQSRTQNLPSIYFEALANRIDAHKAHLTGKSYIVINSNNLLEVKEEDKKSIFDAIENTYNIKVIDSKDGQPDFTSIENSLYVTIEEIHNLLYKVKIQIGVNYAEYSGEGTILHIVYKKGKWEITKTEPAWIS